jgi:hypothetical protein
MADIDSQHSFTRFYKYKNKVEETPFFTKYILGPESKLITTSDNKLLFKQEQKREVKD